MQPLDINRFRANGQSAVTPAKRTRPPRHRPGEWFIWGPIPGAWTSQAAKLPGRALHVALALWFLAGKSKADTVKLSNETLERFGVGRHTAYRALRKLEGAGLVVVKRQRGRCPLVTIERFPKQ